ncbi:MAG: signal peptide peptidase SppA [Sphingomonas sp.]|nr:signal peptide peptidase SppA [Sphingomonas sp.]
MRFARAIWKLLVGVKDALVLILMLIFFGALYAGLSAKPAPVGEGVLTLDLKGALVEQPSKANVSEVLAGGGQAKEYRLRDLVAALEKARTDDRVKAVALDLDGFTGGGQTAISDLADAVRRVRDAKKPVLAYATGYSDDSYQLASAASEIWLNPLGLVATAGPGGQRLYYRGLLEKLGVTAHVYRVGTYKAAVEPFIRDDMSPEAKQNAQALGDALLESWRESVAKGRPKAKIDPYMQNVNAAVAAAGGDLAKAALNAGLVDKIAERQDFEKRLAQLGGSDDGVIGGYKRIKLPAYVRDALADRQTGPIGVVTIAGMIVDGKAPSGTAGGDTIAQLIEKGLARDDLKALVVRVDSPGGSVLASERIRQAILEAKRRKLPVVVSMGNVAASGGYWVSTPADFIYAEPSTITGSIGVFGILPSFEGTRAKLGLGADGIKTTPLSGEPDVFNGPSPEASELLQTGVNSIYARFLGIVAQSRHKTPQQINEIAQGRVWDGGTAHQIGLVDGFGGMSEAIAKAGDLAKLAKDDRGVTYLERPASFKEQLLDMLASQEKDADSSPTDGFAFIGNGQLKLAQAIADMRSILAGPSIQVRCLECPTAGPARVEQRDVGFLAAVSDWLF